MNQKQAHYGGADANCAVEHAVSVSLPMTHGRWLMGQTLYCKLALQVAVCFATAAQSETLKQSKAIPCNHRLKHCGFSQGKQHLRHMTQDQTILKPSQWLFQCHRKLCVQKPGKRARQKNARAKGCGLLCAMLCPSTVWNWDIRKNKRC